MRGWCEVRSLNARQGRHRGRGHGRLWPKSRGRGARRAGQAGGEVGVEKDFQDNTI